MQSVYSLWIYTVESIFSCMILLVNACSEFVPHSGSHSSQNTFLGVIQGGSMCHNLESQCEVLQELRHLNLYPVQICRSLKHTSSHPIEYPAVRLDYVKLFYLFPLEALQGSKGQRGQTAGDSATFRLKIQLGMSSGPFSRGSTVLIQQNCFTFFINKVFINWQSKKNKKRSNVWSRYTNNIYLFSQNTLFDRMWSEHTIFIPSTVKHMLTH